MKMYLIFLDAELCIPIFVQFSPPLQASLQSDEFHPLLTSSKTTNWNLDYLVKILYNIVAAYLILLEKKTQPCD